MTLTDSKLTFMGTYTRASFGTLYGEGIYEEDVSADIYGPKNMLKTPLNMQIFL